REDKIRDNICSSKMSEEDFDIFYASYPRKIGKAKAKAKFLILDKNLLPTILENLEKQKKSSQWQKDNGEFIPHPATWLYQERWEDEVQENTEDEMLRYARQLIKECGEDIAIFRFTKKYTNEDALKLNPILGWI
ncbi:MAG: hypothetical protein ABII98_02605, partial [bacterium]